MPFDPLQFGTGYARHIEDLPALAARSAAFDGAALMRACSAAFEIPKTITQRGWRKRAKMQGRMGACSGFSRSSAGEVLAYYASGQVVHFSEMFCYLENQRQDGTLGRGDTGASIEGSMKAAETSGFCDYELFPYTQAFLNGQYDATIPAAAESQGVTRLINRATVMKSAEDCYHWLATGQGVVLDGTPWLYGMTQIEKVCDVKDLYGQLLGWHAKVLTGYDGDLLDKQGNPCLEEENSHGDQYGDGGWGYLTWRLVDRWIQQEGAVFIGISDLHGMAPRQIESFRGWGG